MDLQLSVFLLFILFTAGHSLDCYVCSSETGSCVGQQTVKTCTAGFSHCVISTAVVQVGGIISTTQFKDCAASADCQNFSYNFGNERVSTSCCNTDKCNAQDAPPDPVLTGKKCFSCEGNICSNTVKCSGTEDRCITITATGSGSSNQSTVVKGCVSKSVCDSTSFNPNVDGISCCSGNLCNGAQSVTQSVLFLCGSLLSYFLMH
ncbi:hypothetical protein R3I93_014326 [Phoxinus phoxinus]|uniref:UPAR/Ly6 domain-containing protein n=1 Tax=Phoxinus phoxinus TaxID=58324 RepID=A0AAN9CP69_9TELE